MSPILRPLNRLGMREVIAAIGFLSITIVPSFGGDPPVVMKEGMMRVMEKDPHLVDEIMADPRHSLAMAYRKNLVSFARTLGRIAQQEETVPPDVARAAVDEMKRSVELLDSYHSRVVACLDPETRSGLGQMPDLMKQHVNSIRDGVSRLDAIVNRDTVPSSAVLKEVQGLMATCRAGMHGAYGNHGDRGDGYKGGEGVEASDTQLKELVNRMNKSTGDEKTGIMADILTRIVNQRASAHDHFTHRFHGLNRSDHEHHCNCDECFYAPPEDLSDDEDSEDDSAL